MHFLTVLQARNPRPRCLARCLFLAWSLLHFFTRSSHCACQSCWIRAQPHDLAWPPSPVKALSPETVIVGGAEGKDFNTWIWRSRSSARNTSQYPLDSKVNCYKHEAMMIFFPRTVIFLTVVINDCSHLSPNICSMWTHTQDKCTLRDLNKSGFWACRILCQTVKITFHASPSIQRIHSQKYCAIGGGVPEPAIEKPHLTSLTCHHFTGDCPSQEAEEGNRSEVLEKVWLGFGTSTGNCLVF